jgi:hypothetical protein
MDELTGQLDLHAIALLDLKSFAKIVPRNPRKDGPLIESMGHACSHNSCLPRASATAGDNHGLRCLEISTRSLSVAEPVQARRPDT